MSLYETNVEIRSLKIEGRKYFTTRLIAKISITRHSVLPFYLACHIAFQLCCVGRYMASNHDNSAVI